MGSERAAYKNEPRKSHGKHEGSHSVVRGGKTSGNMSSLSSFVKPSGTHAKLPAKKTPITELQQMRSAVGGKPSMHHSLLAQSAQGKERKQSFVSVLQPGEKEKFGDRTPTGFRKLGLLGRGGIALVWLAEVKDVSKTGYDQSMLGTKVALKQFPRQKGQMDGSAMIEVETANALFPLELKDGRSGDDDMDYERAYGVSPKKMPGIKSIAKLIDAIEDGKDLWLIYEVGGKSMGKVLTEVKGEFHKGERIYRVQHQLFYQILAQDWTILQTFIRKMAEVFEVLARFGIVHGDLKPDNILVDFEQDMSDIKQLKLIDFGSAFEFHNVTQVTATTPEYLAPELLEFLESRNQMQCKTNLQ